MKNKMNVFLFSLVVVFCLVGFLFLFNYVFHGNECSDCFMHTGFLSTVKDDGFVLVFDEGDEWFVTDWFYPGGFPPLDLDRFVGHIVCIEGVMGCGRCMVTSIKIVDR